MISGGDPDGSIHDSSDGDDSGEDKRQKGAMKLTNKKGKAKVNDRTLQTTRVATSVILSKDVPDVPEKILSSVAARSTRAHPSDEEAMTVDPMPARSVEDAAVCSSSTTLLHLDHAQLPPAIYTKESENPDSPPMAFPLDAGPVLSMDDGDLALTETSTFKLGKHRRSSSSSFCMTPIYLFIFISDFRKAYSGLSNQNSRVQVGRPLPIRRPQSSTPQSSSEDEDMDLPSTIKIPFSQNYKQKTAQKSSRTVDFGQAGSSSARIPSRTPFQR